MFHTTQTKKDLLRLRQWGGQGQICSIKLKYRAGEVKLNEFVRRETTVEEMTKTVTTSSTYVSAWVVFRPSFSARRSSRGRFTAVREPPGRSSSGEANLLQKGPRALLNTCSPESLRTSHSVLQHAPHFNGAHGLG